jgi:ABC-type bacteriocin/lantibiotic exporter with double-glycine peptidase domain
VKFQNTKADCGPTALYNALRAMGLHRSIDELSTLCKTTAQDGTSSKKLWSAVQKLEGLQPWRLKAGKTDHASGLLFLALSTGRAVISLVDNGEHWVSVIGHLQTKVLVADSAHNDLVLSYDLPEWLERWDCGGRVPFEGLVL